VEPAVFERLLGTRPTAYCALKMEVNKMVPGTVADSLL